MASKGWHRHATGVPSRTWYDDGSTVAGGLVRDAEGFDDFYRGTRQRVLTYLYTVSGDLTEAQDAAQEAYLRAWERWSDLAGYANPEQWVRNVGWRLLASRWRKLRGRLAAYRRHGPPAPMDPVTDDVVELVRALRKLPAEQRIAIVLYHWLELPVAVIAEQTGVPVGTVKARLSRGRQALAPLLTSTESEAHHV
jgi:RNA polymerase sigma-70 factor (ECF subfamily)